MKTDTIIKQKNLLIYFRCIFFLCKCVLIKQWLYLKPKKLGNLHLTEVKKSRYSCLPFAVVWQRYCRHIDAPLYKVKLIYVDSFGKRIQHLIKNYSSFPDWGLCSVIAVKTSCVFSHTSSTALGMAKSVCWSGPPQLLNGLPYRHSGLIVTTLVVT